MTTVCAKEFETAHRRSSKAPRKIRFIIITANDKQLKINDYHYNPFFPKLFPDNLKYKGAAEAALFEFHIGCLFGYVQVSGKFIRSACKNIRVAPACKTRRIEIGSIGALVFRLVGNK